MKANIKRTLNNERAKIDSMCLKTEIEIGGSVGEDGKPKVISVDFTDRRFANRLLKLIHRYSHIEEELTAKFAGLDEIEDKFEKLMRISDVEIEVLEEFKDTVNGVFGFDITGELYGDCLPDIARYFELFEALTPYVVAANKVEQERVNDIKKKYGLDRIEQNAESNE